MIHNLTLSRYFGRQYLLWFMVFLGALSGIVYLFEIAELMRRAASRPDASFGLVLEMGLYKLPDTVEQILPFVVLFSAMFAFWRMTRSQELIIARSAGVSAWQFLSPALLVTIVFGFINVTLINPVGAAFNNRYNQLDMKYLQRVPTLELSGAGLWLRQHDNDHRYLLHADHVDSSGNLTLTPLMILVYDSADHYMGRVDAPQAVLDDGYWDIKDAWFNTENQLPQHVDDYHLPTALTFDRIQESMSPPNSISFWELPAFIRALKGIGLPPFLHQLEFQGLLAQPVLLASMVFFAAAFSLRMSRRQSVIGIVVTGVVLGISVFILNNVVRALGANQTLPVALAAWAIPLTALALSNAAILHLEDG